MDTAEPEKAPLSLPSEVLQTFEYSSAFLKRKYNGVAPSPEELIIFHLSGLEAHEIVAHLERQVLAVSGKEPPDKEEHLLQTYLEMEKDREDHPWK